MLLFRQSLKNQQIKRSVGEKNISLQNMYHWCTNFESRIYYHVVLVPLQCDYDKCNGQQTKTACWSLTSGLTPNAALHRIMLNSPEPSYVYVNASSLPQNFTSSCVNI
jgi:hypothetical protein